MLAGDIISAIHCCMWLLGSGRVWLGEPVCHHVKGSSRSGTCGHVALQYEVRVCRRAAATCHIVILADSGPYISKLTIVVIKITLIDTLTGSKRQGTSKPEQREADT